MWLDRVVYVVTNRPNYAMGKWLPSDLILAKTKVTTVMPSSWAIRGGGGDGREQKKKVPLVRPLIEELMARTRAVRKIMKMILSMICRPTDTDDTGRYRYGKCEEGWSENLVPVEVGGSESPNVDSKFFFDKRAYKKFQFGWSGKAWLYSPNQNTGGESKFLPAQKPDFTPQCIGLEAKVKFYR